MTAKNDAPIAMRADRIAPSDDGRAGPDLGIHEVPAGSGSPDRPAMPPSQFLATVGQELWEPMSSMVSMTGLLLETGLTRDQHEIVTELRNSGDRLLRLVRDALDAVEVGAGLVQTASIPFDLRVITDETVAHLRAHASKRDKNLEGRVHHEVPSRLVGDPGRLRQVLWNLCKHTIETNLSGGVVMRVARLHEDLRSVTLRFDIRFYSTDLMGDSVGEDAPGIRPAADSTVVAAGYTGLQLEIARRLVAAMGTRMGVEDESGQAPHAWFDLTLEKQADAPADTVAAPQRASLVGQRVLVVDPTEAIRHALAAKLAEWGCRVDEAAQAEDAMAVAAAAAAADDPLRFVLIDRDLPIMSAHAFGAHLRSQAGGNALHLVMLAAVGQRGDLEDAHACGFDAYLPKPIEWQDLADALVEIEHMAIAGPSGQERQLVTRHWLAETRRARTRVLIVEDDVVSVLVTDWTLRRIGYQVVRVNSASETRRLLAGESAPFDVVVLALRLPDGDGLALAREIRAATPEDRSTAIVALGYECSRLERDRCRAEGIDAYVARPVDLGHLCEIVEQITRTGMPAGPEGEDLYPNGEGLPALRRKAAADRDRIAVHFLVDPETGEVLGGHQVMRAAISPLDVDATLGAAIDIMASETSEAPVANAPPPRVVPPAAATCAVHADDEPRPPLDFARLDVVSMHIPAVRDGLLAAYLHEARAALGVIGQAVSAGDATTLVAEAGRLFQRSEALGAVSCGEAFSGLQRLSREELVAGGKSLVARIATELGRVERAALAMERATSAPV